MLTKPPVALLDTLQSGQKIIYFDIGARDDIAYPWSAVPEDRLMVVGFEPDDAEYRALSGRGYRNRRYYPYGLWSQQEIRPLYINNEPSTSSLYEPNTEWNRQYAPEFNEGRTVKKTAPVDCRALDAIVKQDDWPDFMKLDTQGAEYEILKGAQRILTEGAPMVAAETWCAPVYKGAPLAFKIEEMMYDLGYQQFARSDAAAWTYRAPFPFKGRLTTIGHNILFVKKLEHLKRLPANRLAALVYLLELYGFPDYAYAAVSVNIVIDPVETARLLDAIAHHAKEQNAPSLLLRLLRRLGRASPRYPEIT